MKIDSVISLNYKFKNMKEFSEYDYTGYAGALPIFDKGPFIAYGMYGDLILSSDEENTNRVVLSYIHTQKEIFVNNIEMTKSNFDEIDEVAKIVSENLDNENKIYSALETLGYPVVI